jgi:oligopeptide/dipeptide ABC transporter ATP-binding protein
MSTPMLEVENLRASIRLQRGVVRAVDGISFTVSEGETLGIVGESGSGKTMTGLSLLRLLPQPGGYIEEGSRIRLDGTDLVSLSDAAMARWRGRKISMIAQDPQASLNPVFTIGDQVAAPLRQHRRGFGGANIHQLSVEGLAHVGIPSPELRLNNYPHQFSGGMRQRVVSAMAIGCSPRLLIADEPTSNLDVTIQIQMMELFQRIQRDTKVGIILITHDLGVAAAICHRIAVMYAGRIVECGEVHTIFRYPAHPYTRALLSAMPRLGERHRRLYTIPGQPPSLLAPPRGCRFAARCRDRMERCEDEDPPNFAPSEGHMAACWQLTPPA